MKTIKQLLFTPQRSSLNFFLIFPVFVFFGFGCICSNSENFRSCMSSDGEKFVFSRSATSVIRYSDGAIISSEKGGNTDVLCSDHNEVITIDRQSGDSGQSDKGKTAVWLNSTRTHRLTPDEFWEKYTGFIQNRYFVSTSRGYVTKSKMVGSGKSLKNIYYKVYTQPQVFSLEDSTSGAVKKYHITREMLGLPDSTNYEDLRFSPLALLSQGSQVFALVNDSDKTVIIYQIDLLTGKLTQTSKKNRLPETKSDDNITFDKNGKFVAIALTSFNDKGSKTKNISVLNLESGQRLLENYIPDLAFNNGTLSFIFDEAGEKLGVLVNGYKSGETLYFAIIFDLKTVNEIKKIDLNQLPQKPDIVNSLYFRDDNLLLKYVHKTDNSGFSESEYICKIDIQTSRIMWNIDLPK
jgi:hypothetical protein